MVNDYDVSMPSWKSVIVAKIHVAETIDSDNFSYRAATSLRKSTD